MRIYAVEDFSVDGIDADGDILGTSAIADEFFYTTDIYRAFSNFKDRLGKAYYGYGLGIYEVTLEGEDVELPSLDADAYFERFGDLHEVSREIVAEYINHDLVYEADFYVVEHMVRQSCRYFNMHEICKAAGVNYSTFRGFKNNRQYFSEEKLLALLETMNRVGVCCWNDDLSADIKDVRERMLEVG